MTAASTAARWRVLRAWPTWPISFLVVLQARGLGLDVDLFAGGEPAHHAGQPHTGDLVGLLAQPGRRSRMRLAADAHGDEERDEQGEQAEDAGDAGLDEDADGRPGSTRSW